MTISKKAVAMGLLLGCGFGGGFMLSGLASQRSTLPFFRKADPGDLVKQAARGLVSHAAAKAASGQDDGSAKEMLQAVADAAPAASGGGSDGELSVSLSGLAVTPKAPGTDGAADAAGARAAAAAKAAAAKAAQAGEAVPKGAAAKGAVTKDSAAKDAAAKDAAAKDAAAKAASGLASDKALAAAAKPDGPCPLADLAGADAAAVLDGNTVDVPRARGGHEFLYFSSRRLMGRIRPASIVVQPWNPNGSTLCDGAACRPIHVRRCPEGAGASKVAELQLADGNWAPVLRGNVQGFPSYLPFLDAARAAPRPGQPAAGAARTVSSGTLPIDPDRAYLVQRPGSGDESRVALYDRDGRRYDYARPARETLEEGVTVSLGWWTLQKGLLCQGAVGETSPSCYRSKRRGAGHVTLTAAGQDDGLDLVALADPAPLRPKGDD